MIKRKIQVLIIEDSLLYQRFLQQNIETDDCLAVCGMADCGRKALELIQQIKPDIITLDMNLPDMDGFALLNEIINKWKIPVIVVSGDAPSCEKAISMGARDYIEKIQDTDPRTAEQFKLLLKLKLKMLAEVGSETRPAKRTAASPSVVTEPAFKEESSAKRAERKAFAEKGVRLQEQVIAIGASLGGTETTLQILRRLPDDLPGIVIVQHMPPEYTNAYAMRLDKYCAIEVREARSGDLIKPGTALVARGGCQMTVRKAEHGYRVSVGGTEKYGGFCPSVDVLFRSVAETAGPHALGIILTGMGRDGADGMKKMHDSGAYTIGQDKESCAVFGMPGVAYKLGGVDRLMSPDMIADEIIRYYSNNIKRG